ncbi:hypothetical protein KM043_008540 [Ampulex compressa]|nr:hypothetical protein KM043_008540 [Ampulex compressa]
MSTIGLCHEVDDLPGMHASRRRAEKDRKMALYYDDPYETWNTSGLPRSTAQDLRAFASKPEGSLSLRYADSHDSGVAHYRVTDERAELSCLSEEVDSRSFFVINPADVIPKRRREIQKINFEGARLRSNDANETAFGGRAVNRNQARIPPRFDSSYNDPRLGCAHVNCNRMCKAHRRAVERDSFATCQKVRLTCAERRRRRIVSKSCAGRSSIL